MWIKRIRWLAAGAAATIPAGYAHAEPLRNLSVCSTARLIPGLADRTPDCVPDRAHRAIKLTLTAQTGNGAKPELIGNYSIKTDNYNGVYMPPVVEARAGDRITFHIVDKLRPDVPTLPVARYVRPPTGQGSIQVMNMPTTLTNLHTHGLIVSPKNAVDLGGGVGDNAYRIFDTASCVPTSPMPGMEARACAASAGDVVIDIPSSLAADVYGNDAGAAHPAGLFWYHPHVHGISQHQVNGGMAGLISVGDPRTAIRDASNPASSALQARTDVRYLAIKDIQLTSTSLPETATATAHPLATWQGGEFDPAFCGDLMANATNADYGKGYCMPHGAAPGPRNIWLFTVNGQRNPTITVPANRAHLWRIANLSATVSYQLHLTDVETHKDQPMRIVALDGVVSGRKPSGAAGTSTMPVDAIETTSIRIMPASRIEVYVPNFRKHAGVRALVLRTSGVRTGADADQWPAIDLAQVRLSAVSKSQPDRIKLIAAQQGVPAADLTAPAQVAGVRASSINPGLMPLCAHSKLAPNERRVITMATEDPAPNGIEVLELGSAILRAGTPTPVAATPVQTMKHDVDFSEDDHACAVLGSKEIWEIVNETEEIHNFHIHQTKFRQATADEIAAVGGGVGSSVRAATLTVAADDPLLGDSAESLGVWHDTFPIPAGSRGQPSRVFLHIAFTAPEQVGRFMYHCHILEHEDKGMMAPFEVLLP